MQQWLVLLVLLNQYCICDSKLRIFYISPSTNLQSICSSANNCYTLQDVIKNQSYFIASDTVLELLPGTHHITEQVGNLVINHVSNFILKGSNASNSSQTGINSNVVSILCHLNTSIGLTFRHSTQITISGIHIKNCGAKLTEDAEDVSSFKKLESGEPQFCHYVDDWEEYIPIPCYGTIFSFYGNGMIIQTTLITNSKGVGIFTYHSYSLRMINSHITHNLINCMFLSPYGETSFVDTKIMHGYQTIYNLTAGIYILGTYPRFTVIFTDVTLLNNEGSIYLKIHMNMNYDAGMIKVVLHNSRVMEKESPISKPGIVVEYEPYYTAPNHKFYGKRDRIVIIKHSYLTGSCIAIRNQKPLLQHDLKIGLSNVTITDSYCSSAVTVDSTAFLIVKDVSVVRSNYNIFEIVRSTVYFKSNTVLNNNQGTFLTRQSNVTFTGSLHVLNNSPVEFESTFILHQSKANFLQNTLFQNNSGTQGGAISAYDSILCFNNTVVAFASNSADNGGAVSLKEGSVLRMYYNSTLYFRGNQAKHYGGGIYVEERGLWSPESLSLSCFAETNAQHNSRIKFVKNAAKFAGMSLFGGWIDMCEQTNPLPTLDFSADNGDINYTEVSSYPSRVCICTNSIPNIHTTEVAVEVFPGQTFELQAVAVGQRFGVVPAVIKAETDNKNNIIDDLQWLQDVDVRCSPLKYTICSQNREERIQLTVDQRCTSTILPQQKWLKQYYPELAQLNIRILLKNCSLGFVFDPKKNVCACHPALLRRGITCNITSQTVNRKSYQWISGTQEGDILIHLYCPFDHCKSEDISLDITSPNIQCAYNRSGILCGECPKGLTQVLGTSNCRVCSNAWLTLILAFILAGIALVALLMVLNLTVAVGTINGITFYANIVRANTAIFFPRESANSFPSWFIAWVNLDLGVETCFYDGLSAYVKILLQFLFPIYIWFMVIVIIVSSRFFITSGENIGNNAVQVLATLFLLSYAKLLRVAITIFQGTEMYNSNGNRSLVWSYNGNIDYLGKEHIPLFVTALIVTVFMVVPLTLILFTIQWLQAYSHYRLFFWINKFKPLFDAYTGPYKDKHRYWTGFLLLVRIVLFITFSTNTSGNPAINLLAIITSATSILAYLTLVGSVYKKWPLTLLESSFLFNLIMLATVTLYSLHNVGISERHFIPWTSAMLAFAVTIVILVYHIMLRIKKMVQQLSVFWQIFQKRQTLITNSTKSITSSEIITENLPKVTHTSVELREPLLQ